jgi:hypothetical protein
MEVFTTKEVEKINRLNQLGLPIKRSQTLEYRRYGGTRKSGIGFLFTQEELLEYTKCATDIVYFIEKYCKTMTPDGMKTIKLYDFQKEVLKNYKDNRYNIFFTSRQVGLTSLMSLVFLHQMSFNIDHNITCMDIDKKYNETLIWKIKSSYRALPFFLKQGILTWSKKKLEFENGCSIRIWTSVYKNIAIGYNPDVLYMCNFSHMKHIDELYKNLIPVLTAKSNFKLIIHSGQFGNNFFQKLITNSERPEGDPNKNSYKTQRIYWWQVPGRDEKWKLDVIKEIGEDAWNEEYDLTFTEKKKKKNEL